MSTTKYLHVVLLLTAFITTALSIEVRVLSTLHARGQVNPPDYDQKLIINSNNRWVYPHQQVP